MVQVNTNELIANINRHTCSFFMILQMSLIRIYIQMKNPRSENKEKSINSFHYTIHPIAVQFNREYTHNYYLYLQKNHQILGRYKLSPKIIQSSMKYYFQFPTAIPYFRIISEQNLEFRWSLYKQKISDNYQQEEYVQGDKANLKWCWQNYEEHRENVHWLQIIFEVVKLKFYYLFVVGQTHEKILELVQNQYKKNAIKPSKYLKIYKKYENIENEMRNVNIFQKMIQLAHKKSETTFFLQPQSDKEEMKSANHQISQKKPTKITSKVANSQKDKSIQKSVIQSFFKGQFNKKENILKSPTPQLTFSELEISKDIQQKLEKSQQQVRSEGLLENIKFQAKSEPVILNFDSLEKTRHITCSQYYNRRKQMIVQPFYNHIKYWIVIIAIIIIFGTIVHLRPKVREFKPYHEQPQEEQYIGLKNKKSKTKLKPNKNIDKKNSIKERKKSNKKKSKRK